MNTPFTLLQLSDCHLLSDPDGQYRDQSPDAGLRRLMHALKTLKPDGVILTGDVAEDGSKEAYQRLVEHLSPFDAPKAFIPGNHDDVALMSAMLCAAGYESGPVLDWGGWSLVLLDSTLPNDPSGELADEQLALLDVAYQRQQPTLVFVHHPPMAVGSPWIDCYSLKSPERLMGALDTDWVKAVAFGHVHQPFSAFEQGIQFLSAPATSVNSQVGMSRFTVDPTGPKARWYRLWPNGRWATGVVSAG